ncbi:MAG: tRNA (adenosine(37)-N6)-threonylcarbamoyltransferase complex ATPase subunit type 1 TsaE [Gallionellaceae bacterium]
MHSPDDSRLSFPDEAATMAFAKRLANCLKPGLVIYLQGDLGSGKTTLVRAMLHSLGYSGKVKSPTYTLVEQYEVAGLHLRHFDLYRFHDEAEWETAGLQDEFNGRNICLIEWPEKAMGLAPAADLQISLGILPEGRTVKIHASTRTGRECLSNL